MKINFIQKDNLKFLISDAIILSGLPFLTLYLRFDGNELDLLSHYIQDWSIPTAVASLIIFALCGMYKRLWNYAGLRDFLTIGIAVTLSTAFNFFALKLLAVPLPESFFVLEWLAGLCLITATRIAIRVERLVKKESALFILPDTLIFAALPFIVLLIFFDAQEREIFSLYFETWDAALVTGALIIFFVFGLYSREWRNSTPKDFVSVTIAVVFSVMLSFLILKTLRAPLPRTIFMAEWIIGLILISAPRIFYRLKFGGDLLTVSKRRALIVGAGEAGAMLLKEIRAQSKNMDIIGFADDDNAKIGSKLDDIPVLGSTNDIPAIVKKFRITEILIAIPSASGKDMRRIVELSQKTGCTVKNLPSIIEMVDGRVQIQQLRNVSIEDLLRRKPIRLDLNEIMKYIVGKTVMITGAGGSIGSELSRQIAGVGAKKILLLGRGENSIYEIHRELITRFPDKDFVTLIATVTDAERMREIFKTYRPNVIFHAAAHKHVPLMEMQPDEAVRNNIFGTKNVAELALEFGADIFLLVSTDKAVNPTSVMGATKRVSELIMQELQHKSTSTRFICTRFGNVLGSRGSVVPLFERQIAAGGPVTVTHPEMVRFFMTIPEAVQLVLQAGAQGTGGEVFLFDMGEQVKIKDMAEDLIRLHGLEPGRDIEIVFTGMRPGEKLYEELLTAGEGTQSTKHSKIFRAKVDEVPADILEKNLAILRSTRDKNTILAVFKELIPTYHHEELKK